MWMSESVLIDYRSRTVSDADLQSISTPRTDQYLGNDIKSVDSWSLSGGTAMRHACLGKRLNVRRRIPCRLRTIVWHLRCIARQTVMSSYVSMTNSLASEYSILWGGHRSCVRLWSLNPRVVVAGLLIQLGFFQKKSLTFAIGRLSVTSRYAIVLQIWSKFPY
jgi:hypothetical protein